MKREALVIHQMHTLSQSGGWFLVGKASAVDSDGDGGGWQELNQFRSGVKGSSSYVKKTKAPVSFIFITTVKAKV